MGQRWVGGAVLLAALLAGGGCASGPAGVGVTGGGTLDGQPVGRGNDATIRFEPAHPKGRGVEAFIDQGKYTLRAAPGTYKVAVTWSKSTGKKLNPKMAGPGAEAELTVSMIPARYNERTELRAEVAPGK